MKFVVDGVANSAPADTTLIRLLVRGHKIANRFSPACAGNGVTGAATSTRRTVQPRVCGERGGDTQAVATAIGSAPRVRGTEAQHYYQFSRERFSPACAGNGSGNVLFSASTTVQPRVCGERAFLAIPAAPYFGSAPRVRGTAKDD